MKRLISEIDFSDVLVFAGLALTGYGISLISVPATWIVVGIVLFLLGIFTATPRRSNKS